MDTFIQQIINGLLLGSMYALIALGYTMVYGVLNLINFAHGDVLMIGAMVGLSILGLLDAYAPGLSLFANVALASLQQDCAPTATLQQRAGFSHGKHPIPACFRGHRAATHHIRGRHP